MPTEPSKPTRRAAQLVLVVALVMPGIMLWSWSRPTAAPPIEVPPLALSPRDIATQLDADAVATAAAPESESAAARQAVYDETNLAEVEANDYPPDARDRRDRLQAATLAVVEAHGEEVLEQIRAADVARMERGLHGELGPTDTNEALGAFVEMMERYSMSESRHQVAPRFVVRTAFKARWNAVHGRELTEGFSVVELQAHHGWLALHAATAPTDLRLDAVEQFHAAGGSRALEARGVLLLQAGRREEATDAFTQAYDERPNFRVRNHALFTAARGEEG